MSIYVFKIRRYSIWYRLATVPFGEIRILNRHKAVELALYTCLSHRCNRITNMKKVNIKIIGVGSGGITTIDKYKRINKNINTIALDTDSKLLDNVTVSQKLLLIGGIRDAFKTTIYPHQVRDAAFESSETIKEILNDSDIVIIVAFLGGATGSGAAPIIANVSKEIGALTVSIVITPFHFEGSKRRKLAKEGLENIKLESDFIIIMPNEDISSAVDKNLGILGIKETFIFISGLVNKEINNIIKLIFFLGENAVNLDFEDLKTVIQYSIIQNRKTFKLYNIQHFVRPDIRVVNSGL